ncbi:hypothetical protein [Noviherbaspirillum aridicola]|uniref:Uncharacterized protein n=1 Tax=Noviherbaspirillum aridicola TaxID=2849687 RepID=A0ABQ4Q1S9_9BURK|nr:hypothetical protein [Noviherbaspirillum aridicola]GIZ51138.1 hypothetical protein NCCP691_11520 [Noviherbaspirillum aridicola]
MKKIAPSEQVIEDIVEATLGEHASAREKHVLRETLHGLVRLAKVEQVADIKANVRRLAGALETQSARRRAKAILMAQRLPGLLEQAQQAFEFKH